jgi:uncharacterized paraquat-inducible protein A
MLMFRCEGCGQQAEVPDHLWAKGVQCHRCGKSAGGTVPVEKKGIRGVNAIAVVLAAGVLVVLALALLSYFFKIVNY